MPLILLLGCSAPSVAEAMTRALASDTPWTEAVAACAHTGSQREACLAGAVRAHVDAPEDACEGLVDDRWHGECAFVLGERHAARGDRWKALTACADARNFQGECLYHAWSFELQLRARGHTSAVDAWPTLQDSIAFWSAQRTLQNNADAQLVGDAWFAANDENPPARLFDCETLPSAIDRASCATGTLAFVQRRVAEEAASGRVPPRMLERACRDPVAGREVFGGFYVPDPRMDAALDDAVRKVCAKDPTLHRWNPILGGRR